MVQAALQYHFYGIGPNVAARLCAKLSIHPTARLSSLNHPTLTALTFEMSKLKLDTDLKNELRGNLERLRDLGTYRGRRHAQVRTSAPPPYFPVIFCERELMPLPYLRDTMLTLIYRVYR